MNPKVHLGELVEPAPVARAGQMELPVLSMTRSAGLMLQEDVFKKTVAGRDTSKYKVVEPNQLVVGIHIDEGAIGFSKPGQKGMVSPAYSLWSLSHPDRVLPTFLDRFIRSPQAIAYFVAHYRKTADRRGRLTRERFLALEVPLPPVEEQRRIVAILDAADALRAKRRKAIEKLDELTQSVFIDLFGDPAKSRWPLVSFKSLLVRSLRNGVSPSGSGEFLGEVLILSAVTGSVFDGSKTKESTFAVPHRADKTVSTEDLLICRGNGNLSLVGRAKYPSDSLPSVAFPDTMIAAVCDDDISSKAYLTHVWDGSGVRRQIESLARTTNGTHKINQRMIESVKLPLPPIGLQHEFEDAQERIAHHRVHVERDSAHLDHLFASIQQRAFQGEL